jgi:hypothetical protein
MYQILSHKCLVLSEVNRKQKHYIYTSKQILHDHVCKHVDESSDHASLVQHCHEID